MSLADHFGLFALGSVRARPGRRRVSAAALLGPAAPKVQKRGDGKMAGLGWHAAHQSLWGDDGDAAIDADPAGDDDLKFF